ncbi:MAG TPA: acyl-CoA dehydratase activase [bacterium]|nr:acyl-CoA dehydratase activase [bacterium]
MERTGIDIGSRSIEVVILNGDRVQRRQCDTGHDPLNQVRRLLNGVRPDRAMVTGYGRQMLEVEWDLPAVTEIKAYARGVHYMDGSSRTILDIGGQDTKVIALGPDGRIRKFEMNDRCAAGTGKFLELMASCLGFSLEAFGAAAMTAETSVQINSMCAVFAESEVTSLVTRGVDRHAIARGVHKAVAGRAVTMLNRVRWTEPLVFAGGVARNPAMVQILERMLDVRVQVPEYPQFVGALGAALLA